MTKTVLTVLLAAFVLSANTVLTEEPYNFRASAAYRVLPRADRTRLEQVHRDFMMLWGALDRYADNHGGKLPENLDELAPAYLLELPRDPFATEETRKEKPKYASPSKGGWGYRYRKGPMLRTMKREQDRAWVISSVGLPEFPYLAERGNISLYVCKGVWL